jgi:hypothetical protein
LLSAAFTAGETGSMKSVGSFSGSSVTTTLGSALVRADATGAGPKPWRYAHADLNEPHTLNELNQEEAKAGCVAGASVDTSLGRVAGCVAGVDTGLVCSTGTFTAGLSLTGWVAGAATGRSTSIAWRTKLRIELLSLAVICWPVSSWRRRIASANFGFRLMAEFRNQIARSRLPSGLASSSWAER